MKTKRVSTVGVWVACVVLGCGATGVMAQQQRQTPFPPRPQPNDPMTRGLPERDGMSDPLAGRMEEQQAIARNNDRQKRLVADTDKLLGLATQLKEQVEKTDKNTLSVDVIKKAEEIEKLAKSVKDRMKGGM